MANNNLLQLAKQANPSPVFIQRALLLAEDSFATVLLILVVDKYGPDVLTWAPATIRMELEQDFQLKLPKENLDKIMAAITVVTTNFFYKDVTRFIEICNIFAGDNFQPDVFDPADTGEILLGVSEAILLYPPNEDPEDSEFSAEVRGYIQKVLNRDGIMKPFSVLRLAFSKDQSTHVDVAYADDPEMYQAVYSSQQEKTDGLKQVYLENMASLKEQLVMLPVRGGDTKEVVQQLDKLVATVL